MNQVVERGTKRDKEIPGVPDPETISDLVRTLRAARSAEYHRYGSSRERGSVERCV